MSTYAVFGMSRHRAVELARKAVKPKRDESAFDWERRCQEEADKTMEGDRCIQLSERFDAPQFAEDFKRIAYRDGAKRLHIKSYCSNGCDPVTKKPKYHWVLGYEEPPPRFVASGE